jgi:hypothetical protein
MLVIKNRETLKGEKVIVSRSKTYDVEGMYEYEDHYQIHLRSNGDKNLMDELLILKRNKEYTNEFKYNCYDLYDSNLPHHRVSLTINTMKNKLWFIEAIENVLKQMN